MFHLPCGQVDQKPIEQKPNLSTKLHISRAFLIKKVAMAIQIKNFGLQNIKNELRLTLKSHREWGVPPLASPSVAGMFLALRGGHPSQIFLGGGGRELV